MNSNYTTYSKKDLLELGIFPFGKTKLNTLLQAGVLPVVKVGRHYLVNEKELDAWFQRNKGKEIKY